MRSLKKLELLSATPRATLKHLSCSPNFPRASHLDERTLTYEPIVSLHILQKRFYFFLYFLDPERPTSYFKVTLLTFYDIVHVWAIIEREILRVHTVKTMFDSINHHEHGKYRLLT